MKTATPKHNNIELTDNEAAVIRALRFFSESIHFQAWFARTEDSKTQAAEHITFLPESVGIEMSIVGNLIHASHAMPPQTVNQRVVHASPYSSRIEGLIYPNWEISASSGGGSRGAKLSFLLADDMSIHIQDRGFATASGVHNFIAQTQSSKKNQGKACVLSAIIDTARPRYNGELIEPDKLAFLEGTIARLQANPEAPQTFGYVLPFFRNQ